MAHAALQNYDEALERYLPLLERKPADPGFYANLSLTLIELKRFEVADKVIQLGMNLASETTNRLALAQLQDVRTRLNEAMGLGELPGLLGK